MKPAPTEAEAAPAWIGWGPFLAGVTMTSAGAAGIALARDPPPALRRQDWWTPQVATLIQTLGWVLLAWSALYFLLRTLRGIGQVVAEIDRLRTERVDLWRTVARWRPVIVASAILVADAAVAVLEGAGFGIVLVLSAVAVLAWAFNALELHGGPAKRAIAKAGYPALLVLLGASIALSGGDLLTAFAELSVAPRAMALLTALAFLVLPAIGRDAPRQVVTTPVGAGAEDAAEPLGNVGSAVK